MFFKRRNKEKPAEAAETPLAATKEDGTAAGTGGGTPPESDGIPAEALRRGVDAAALGFKTTADLEPEDGPLGQERALADLDFGLNMGGRDFNVFVLGPRGSGTRTSVCAHLAKQQRNAATPPDWIYVPNFEDPHRLRALRLPAGRAALFAERIDAAVAELRATLPAAFEAEDYRARHRAIEENYRSAHDDALDALHAKAADQNIAVLRTPLGFGMAPMHDGQVVKPEVFNQLPQVMRRDVESRVGALQSELESILASAPAVDKERRRQLAALNVEAARHPIEAALDGLSQEFADVPDATAFLAEMERDLIANAQAFLSAAMHDGGLRRYAVHVVVAHANDAGAPLVSETDPTPHGLTGAIGSAADGAPPATAARRIHAGVLHKANGGVLVIDARCPITAPEAWKTLKTALKTREIRLSSPSTCAAALATSIPLDAKVILVGTSDDYTHLEAADADFALLFKVQVCFEPAIARSAATDNRFARLVASVVATHALKPLDAGGVARLIEEASRLAGHRDKVTLDVGRIADIAREADVWSKHAGRDVTTAEDVARAMAERAQRGDRVRARTRSRWTSASRLGETAGGRLGQVIALSTARAGGVRLGEVHRVVAGVHGGRGGVAEIVHAGVANARHASILRSYLAGTFAQAVPLALGAALAVEPPLDAALDSGVPLAELLALISALADEPLRQDLAVAGAVDPWGDVQPVDGINEQIEGFYDACQASALPGTPGVLIPDGNRMHLMARQDVVDAVRNGRFVLHGIKTVDDALALMAARNTGVRGADGYFAADSLNGRVEAKLQAFADAQRAFRHGADAVSGVREGRT